MATLEQHIAYLKQHGMARTNRFSVVIPLPDKLVLPSRNFGGVDGSELQQTSVNNNRTYGTSSSIEGTRSLELKVSQTNFPMKNINLVESKYNGDIHKMGGTITYGAQQFVFECSEDLYEKNIIDAWMNLVVDPTTYENNYYHDYVTDIIVNQLDMNDKPTHTIVLQDAFPMMCNELTLSNKEMNNSHELMTMFSFRRWYSSSAESASSVITNDQIYNIIESNDSLNPYLSDIKNDSKIVSSIDIIEKLKSLNLNGDADYVVRQLENIVYSTTSDTINKAAGLMNEIKYEVNRSMGLDDYDVNIISSSIDKALDALIPDFTW